MTPNALLAKIEELLPDEQAEVEDFVESIRLRHGQRRSVPTNRAELLARIDARRERLLREHGPFPDSTSVIRELREKGA